MLPLSTPELIRMRLAEAINLTLRAPDFRTEMEAAGFEVGDGLSPAQSGDYIAAEQAKWRPIVAATGARLQ
jgi:tripartite-type tricarboxylate transporter receptor subunit TctC